MLKGKSIFSLLIFALLCATAQGQFSLPGTSAPRFSSAERAKISAALNTTAVQPGQQAVLAIVVDIAKGFHAQSHTPSQKNFIKFEVNVDDNPTLKSFAPTYPAGVIHSYPALGELNVYDGRVITYVPLQINADASPGALQIKGMVRLQICDDSVCFAPENRPIEVNTQIVPAGQRVDPNQPELFANFDPATFSKLAPPGAADEQSSATLFGITLDRDAYLLAFAGAFIVGMIFNVVPCVLPVLPLKALGFYEVAQHNRAKCLALGAVFSLGIIATFGALAVPVLVLKTVEGQGYLQWGQLFGNPWFAGAITLILVVMAAGMFGTFGVGLPQWVYRITPRHDTYSGNFLFGILTAVLSTPCTFGLFAALLVWATLQPPVVGVSMLMVVGAGMAFPYLLLSAFPQLARNMPRTGPWSEVVKQMMGFLLLAMAVYFGQMFLPHALRGPGMWWAIFAIIAAAGVFLIIRAAQLAPRAFPIAIACTVALLIVAPAFAVTLKLTNTIGWTEYSAQSLAAARASGKPVIVKFTATWCANCHTVEATVFGNDETIKQLRALNAIPIKADLTSDSAPGWQLLRQLHPVGAIPFTAVYLPSEDKPRTLVGIYSNADLLKAVGNGT